MSSRLSLIFLCVLVSLTAGLISGCAGSPPPISISLSSSAPATDEGQAVRIKATLTNDNFSGVRWGLAGPGSLSGATTTSVIYNAPQATQGFTAQTAMIEAVSAADRNKTATIQIGVNPYPQIPFQTLPNGSVGTPYSQSIALTGGTPPFEWSVYNGPIITGCCVGGSVPDGLKLDASSGAISGTPTGGGTWYFEGMVTDAAGVTVDNGFLSIQINPASGTRNPVPFLNQPLVPAAIAPGSGGFTLRVSGTGFASGATVDFNGAPLATTFVDGGNLSANVPATAVAAAGTVSVRVVNPGPGGGRSNVAQFQVAAPETTINFVSAANSPLQVVDAGGIATGDFNEDGKPDLVVTSGIRMYVFLGNGDGTFTVAQGAPFPVPSPPYDDFGTPFAGGVTIADMDNSGHEGLVVSLGENEAAAIFLGKGDGTFARSSAAFADAPAFSFVPTSIADFNRDGNLDLAFPSLVSLGYGDGAFTDAGQLFNAGFPQLTAAGDFNGDGKLDVAVTNAGSQAVPGSGLSISLGNGDGTFTSAPGSPIFFGNTPSGILAADFNGDGKLDLAMTDVGANTVVIMLGNGDGTFGPPSTIPVGNPVGGMVAGDFLANGKLDLAIADPNDGTVTVLLGNGDGTFTEAANSPFTAGKGADSIAAADFNGDGRLDLAITNAQDGTVSIWLQQ